MLFRKNNFGRKMAKQLSIKSLRMKINKHRDVHSDRPSKIIRF